MPEIVYYSDSFVRVTSEWVKLGDKTYRLADIRSLRVWSTQTEPLRELPYFLILAGSFTTFGLLNIQHIVSDNWQNVVLWLFWTGIAIGLAGLVVLLVQMLWKARCLYGITLIGSFGMTTPYASDDEQHVRQVAAAIHTALDARTSLFSPTDSEPVAPGDKR
jgi:hypothetical protein